MLDEHGGACWSLAGDGHHHAGYVGHENGGIEEPELVDAFRDRSQHSVDPRRCLPAEVDGLTERGVCAAVQFLCDRCSDDGDGQPEQFGAVVERSSSLERQSEHLEDRRRHRDALDLRRAAERPASEAACRHVADAWQVAETRRLGEREAERLARLERHVLRPRVGEAHDQHVRSELTCECTDLLALPGVDRGDRGEGCDAESDREDGEDGVGRTRRPHQ